MQKIPASIEVVNSSGIFHFIRCKPNSPKFFEFSCVPEKRLSLTNQKEPACSRLLVSVLKTVLLLFLEYCSEKTELAPDPYFVCSALLNTKDKY